jgi:hypothetical protein
MRSNKLFSVIQVQEKLLVIIFKTSDIFRIHKKEEEEEVKDAFLLMG